MVDEERTTSTLGPPPFQEPAPDVDRPDRIPDVEHPAETVPDAKRLARDQARMTARPGSST